MLAVMDKNTGIKTAACVNLLDEPTLPPGGQIFPYQTVITATTVDEASAVVDQIMEIMGEVMRGRIPPPEVFETLDNPEAPRSEVNTLHGKINEEILLRLFCIAGAAYTSGNLKRKSPVNTLYQAVELLGFQKVKALVLALAFFSGTDPQMKLLFAQAYATSVLAGFLAQQMEYRQESARKVERGGLLLDVGRVWLMLYQKQCQGKGPLIDNAFEMQWHPLMGDKIARHYHMPAYVSAMILSTALHLNGKYLMLIGVARLAHNAVAASFHQHQNRLAFSCDTPKPDDDMNTHIATIIADQFRAVGLANHLFVVQRATTA